MDMATDSPAVYQSTAAIVAVYGFYRVFITGAYGGFMPGK